MAIGSVCHWSLSEYQAVKLYGTIPNCRNHQHLSRSRALERIVTDLSSEVGSEFGFNAILDHQSNMSVWKSRLSAGFNVRQLVRLVQG